MSQAEIIVENQLLARELKRDSKFVYPGSTIKISDDLVK